MNDVLFGLWAMAGGRVSVSMGDITATKGFDDFAKLATWPGSCTSPQAHLGVAAGI
jgi:hypothetical protein